MKVKAIYFSPTGTTKKVVTHLAKHLSSETEFVDVTLPKQRDRIIEINDDLVILGLPVYGGRIPALIEPYLRSIKGKHTPCVIVGVYGNRDYDDALLEMRDIMTEQDFRPVAAGAFIGVHSYTTSVATDRPDEKDLRILHGFSKDIINSMDKDCELKIKGSYPYKERKKSSPIGPVIDDRCMSCGICAINCPTGALKYNGKLKVDETLCIKCNACVRICPIGSVGFADKLDPFIHWLEENCSDRREPECFTIL